MNLYTELILDLAKNPLNKRVLAHPDFTGSGVNTTCGDHIRLYVLMEKGKVKDASWQGDGCAISAAAASALTEEIKGKNVKELGLLCKKNLFEWLDIEELGPARVKCVTLCLETLKSALLGR